MSPNNLGDPLKEVSVNLGSICLSVIVVCDNGVYGVRGDYGLSDGSITLLISSSSSRYIVAM
jgi:hypothetical protein